MGRKRLDVTRQRFGELTAIAPAHCDFGSPSFWLFKCDCGNEKVIRLNNVTSGHTSTCGNCKKQKSHKQIKRSATAHGLSRSPEYQAWKAMKQRCSNSNDKRYEKYGGRGIVVCERWLEFRNFYTDMGPRPGKAYSLDRINNDGNYEPGNCRWATLSEQNSNKRYPQGLKRSSRKSPCVS